MSKHKNQTNNPVSEARWRSKVMKTEPLIARYDRAVTQAKIGLQTRGFNNDLENAQLEINRLESKLNEKGLSVANINRLVQLRKDVKLAELLKELNQL